MKKIIAMLGIIVVASGLAALVWMKPARHENEEEKVTTEVAVRVAKIARATLRGYVTAYGTVEAEPPGEHPAASARVAASAVGVVATVNCAEGQRVKKGAILFQLDSRAADVAAQKARVAVEFAEKNFERQKKLLQIEGTSQKATQEAELQLAAARSELAAAQTQQALLRVQAPLSGTVTRVNVKPGEAVDLATVLAEMVNLDRLVVNANVPSAELAALKPGQSVEVLADRTAPPVAASLAFIGSQVDAKTGTASVRATLPSNTGLRPGQFVMLRIVSEEHEGRLAVPIASVVKDAEGNTVIALVTGDKAVQRAVKAGLRDGGLVEVEGEGLKEGDVVVSEGAYALPKKTKVRLIGQ
ncbi:MAG: efflux RND transporter periplasmic adaptor subunit [Verrucomicrobia bacterium]|nr:efflux RND transporter periplasmic adaptor subunit [Verrucomicrobiota bacterium]